MIRFSIDRVIDAPIGDVFDRLADIDGYGEWMSQAGLFRGSKQLSPGRTEVGTDFYDRSRFGKLYGEVTEHERPSRLAFRQVLFRNGDPVFVSRPSYVLEPTGDGRTRIYHYAEAEFRGMFRILEPAGHVIARRERSRVLDSLQASLG